MNDEIYLYSLAFDKFFIDFDVKKRASIELTRGFSSHGPNFVFAVAETWLRIESSRYLIIPAIRPGNLIEELKDFSMQLTNPSSVKNLENLISRGGWCAWMRGYWDRLDNDCNIDDEDIYGLLIPLSLMESRQGHIASYRYNGVPTIEVATRQEDGCEITSAWSEFDPKTIASQIRELQEAIAVKILAAMQQ
jgi:hypothetical protein